MSIFGEDEDEEVPTPLQLKGVVAKCFAKKHEKEFCEHVNQLIDDLITRDLGRPIITDSFFLF